MSYKQVISNANHQDDLAAAAPLQSQEAAELAYQRSELMLSSVGDGVCGVDLEGRITFLNQTGRTILGLNGDEGIGASLHALTHHHHADGSEYPIEDCPLYQTLHDGLLRQEDSDVYWRQDGTAVPVEFTTAPMYQNGTLTGAVNVFRDISRRVQAEKRIAHNLAITAAMERVLRRSLENAPLETILENALAEVLALPWLHLEDRGCIFLTDRARGDLRMAAWRNLSPQIVDGCATVPLGYCLCGRVAASGVSLFTDCLDHRHEMSYLGMREHGHYCVPIVVAGDLLGVLNTYVEHGHRYDEGEKRFLVMFADTLAGIIKRKRIEEDLRDHQNRLAAITATLFEGVLQVTANGEIIFANQSAQRLLGVEALVGHPLDSVMTLLALGEPVAFAQSPFQRVIETGSTAVDDDAVFATTGGRRLAIAYAAAQLREEGKPDAVVISFRDIEALKTAQREALQASRLASVGQLAAGIAHEINTPIQYIGDNLRFIDDALARMGSILAAGQELAADQAVPSEVAARFEDAVKAAKLPFLLAETPVALRESLDGVAQIARIVLSMKDFAHPGTSSKAMTDLNRALDSTLTVSHTVWKEVAEAKTDFDPTLPPVLCHAGEMNQVFLNLIVNAAHAIATSGKPLPGRITVTTRLDDGYAEITVADSGTGVPAAIRDRIFDPFFTTKEVGQGTGQGLAICRDVVVTKHGGSLEVADNDGGGAVFVIRLPMNGGMAAAEPLQR